MTGINTSIDLILPALPDTYDPELFQQLLKVYNAIRSVAMGLDDYTESGTLGLDMVLTLGQVSTELTKLRARVRELEEQRATDTFQVDWSQPGEIGKSVPNSGNFTTLNVLEVSSLQNTTLKKVGFNGNTASDKIPLAAVATDPATTQVLANSMRSLLVTFGLGS